MLHSRGTVKEMLGRFRLQGPLAVVTKNSWCLVRAGGRLKANLRFSPPAFLFKWMKIPVAASCSTQLGWLMSGTGRGSVSEYMLYNFNTGMKSAVGFFCMEPEMNCSNTHINLSLPAVRFLLSS